MCIFHRDPIADAFDVHLTYLIPIEVSYRASQYREAAPDHPDPRKKRFMVKKRRETVAKPARNSIFPAASSIP
jgi:hypothetical protein